MEPGDLIRAALTLWRGDALPKWLRGPEDGSDLAPLLSAVARAIGRAGALRLAAVLGGTEQLVSATPEPEDMVSLVLGPDRARRLGQRLCPEGDDVLTIPIGPFNVKTVLRQRIRVLLVLGRTCEEIVETIGVRRSLVWRSERGLMREGLVPAVMGSVGGELNESVMLARAVDLEGLIRDGRALPEWLSGPEDGSDLPEPLPEIAAVLGRAKALLLSAYIGGARVYLPRVPNANNRFSVVLGLDDARRLAAELTAGRTGIQFDMPTGPITFLNYRGWRVRSLILTGMPTDRVALETGINRRNVNRAAAKLRAEGRTIPARWSMPTGAALSSMLALAGPSTAKRGDDRP